MLPYKMSPIFYWFLTSDTLGTGSKITRVIKTIDSPPKKIAQGKAEKHSGHSGHLATGRDKTADQS